MTCTSDLIPLQKSWRMFLKAPQNCSSIYVLFTDRITRSVHGNRKARALHKTEGFVFLSTDRVTRVANTSLHGTIFSPNSLTKANFPQMLRYMIFSNYFNVNSILSCLKVSKNITGQTIPLNIDSVLSKNNRIFDNQCFPAVVMKKVVRIVLYGPPFNQSNCKKASPYHQMPSDKRRYCFFIFIFLPPLTLHSNIKLS